MQTKQRRRAADKRRDAQEERKQSRKKPPPSTPSATPPREPLDIRAGDVVILNGGFNELYAPHSGTSRAARRARARACAPATPPRAPAVARLPREQAGTVSIASGAQARRAVRAGTANAERGRALGAGRVGARASAPWSLGRAGLGLSPPSLHSGQVRRARARRAAAQLQASCPPSAGQEPPPPWSRKLRLSEKCQTLSAHGQWSVSLCTARAGHEARAMRGQPGCRMPTFDRAAAILTWRLQRMPACFLFAPL